MEYEHVCVNKKHKVFFFFFFAWPEQRVYGALSELKELQ